MAAQPWFQQLDPVSRRAFVVFKANSTEEQRDTVRGFIERPQHAFQQQQNARLVAGLLGGSGALTKEPCPPALLVEAIERWSARQAEHATFDPNYVTLTTDVDDLWDAKRVQGSMRALDEAPLREGFICASLRNYDPKSPVWVVPVGMVDGADPRHPRSGKPEAAELWRDGMYHLPRKGVNTVATTHPEHAHP